MFEPKPLASLSAGLLARKGDARPAMTRAYVPMTSIAALPVAVQQDIVREEVLDDLGWNDLGGNLPDPSPASPAPVVRQQQARIAKSFAGGAKKGDRAQVAPRKTTAAFTLRLDPERHLRLRLASAITHRSAQQIVTQALDAWLERQPGFDRLAVQTRKLLLETGEG